MAGTWGKALAGALCGAVSVGLVATTASPAGAGYDATWTFDSRPAGMPATAVPAYTLDAATVHVRGSVTTKVSGTVTLGAEPDVDTDALLHVSLGVVQGATCVTRWETVMSTFAPGAEGSRDGSSITFGQAVSAPDAYTWDCGHVEVTDTLVPSTVHDRLDGRVLQVVAVDRGAFVNIGRVRHKHLPVGEWSQIRVVLNNRRADLTRIRLVGEGAGVRVRPYVVRQPIDRRERIVVHLPVRLLERRVRHLELTTYPSGDDIAFASVDRKTVRIWPRHHRRDR